jgi:hypothetical protein
MKPLPVQMPASGKPASESIPSLPVVLATPAGEYSKANRRAGACPVQRAYPWLLATSTAVAALFCLMYITKPVIIAASDASSQTVPSQALAMAETSAKSANLMPSADRLPGEEHPAANGVKPTATDPRRALPGSAAASAFEETNMRIQHILTAEAPGGHLNRIDIDVPVLYQSRSLRWTPTEVAEARDLLVRLMDYQEKSQALRSEGVDLLAAWNHLIEGSIPSGDLRADSPSLPANQEDAADSPRPAGLITTESIQLQPSGK